MRGRKSGSEDEGEGRSRGKKGTAEWGLAYILLLAGPAGCVTCPSSLQTAGAAAIRTVAAFHVPAARGRVWAVRASDRPCMARSLIHGIRSGDPAPLPKYLPSDLFSESPRLGGRRLRFVSVRELSSHASAAGLMVPSFFLRATVVPAQAGVRRSLRGLAMTLTL